MVAVSVFTDKVVFDVLGWSRVWAFKRQIVVPKSAIRGVRADPRVNPVAWRGIRFPGTYVPGVITAGTFYRNGIKTFCDIRRGNRTVVVDLAGASYDRLVIEVEEPATTVHDLEMATTGNMGAP